MNILGIDVGGTGIKGALVDVGKGQLITARHRILTPQPATPAAMTNVICEIAAHFSHTGPVGIGLPAPIVNGIVRNAANIDKSWIGLNADDYISEKCGCQVTMVNDADAAGLAEMSFGAGKNSNGVVIIITLGTGIGSGFFVNGKLVPNTELGHIFMPNQKKDAEYLASAVARERMGLKWQEWAITYLDPYLKQLELLFWPTKFIIGGGISKKHEKFIPHLTVSAEVVPALLRNNAGIIGAAMAAVT